MVGVEENKNSAGGTSSIHFRGELLPGFSLDEAKAHASLLFKLTPEKCEALFSGQPVILRKDLPAAEVDAYLARIARTGMRVEVVSDAAPAVAATPTPVEVPIEAPVVVVAEGITCPNCGEQQPKRTLCRKCGTDMPRVIAARQQEEQEAQAARAEERAARTGSPRGGSQRTTFAEDPVPLIGLSWHGRISRTRYLQVSLLSYALMGLMGVAFLNSGFTLFSVLLVLALLFVFCLWGLRMTALRLHDIGISAWAMLLLLIPVVQFLFSLALLFIPGKDEANDWGERAPPAGGMGLILSIGLTILSVALVMSNAAKLAAIQAEVGNPASAEEMTL